MQERRSLTNARERLFSTVSGEGGNSFISLRSGKELKATEAQRIVTQVWRIPLERIRINAVSERPEEAVEVYANDKCSIPAGMGKYISLCRQIVE